MIKDDVVMRKDCMEVCEKQIIAVVIKMIIDIKNQCVKLFFIVLKEIIVVAS